MKRYFIGDIHGCHKELELLIQKIGFDPSCDHLYSVGDVTNKGPNSLATLDLVKKYNITCVRGNHDQLFLDTYTTPFEERTPREHTFMKQFEGREHECSEIISSWPLYIELEDIILVHAGLEPGNRHLKDIEPRILLTIRTWDGTGADLNNPDHPKWYECDSWDKMIIFGHWAINGLVYSPNFIGLDTGCVYGGSLTAYCPEDNLFFEVPSFQPKVH